MKIYLLVDENTSFLRKTAALLKDPQKLLACVLVVTHVHPDQGWGLASWCFCALC